MAKQILRKKAMHARSKAALPPWAAAILAAFAGGVAAAAALMAVFAFVCERFSLPVGVVRPMALAAVWCAAAVSGYILAGRLGQQRLLCGLLCGLFYCGCLLLASFLAAGTVDLQGANMALPVALLLGGLVGGVVSAMRAVKDRPWQPVGRSAQPHRALYRRPAERTGRSGIGVWLGLGAALLLGYIPGVWIGRDGGFGISALAEHYLDKQTYAAFGPVFADLFAAAFVQSTLLLLCGFCALGLGLLAAFFSLKGMYLGYCAASIYAAGGAKSLTAHWLLSLLPDLGVLAALLCLAGHAVPLSVALLQTAFGESTVPSATYARARTLILRYALTVAVTALCSGLGALLDVFLAGVLL